MATVPLVEERWTSWLFDNRRSEAGSLMSAAMFNRIYPKGNEKIKIEIPVSVRDRTVGDIDIDPATEKLIEQNGKGLTETIETTKDEIRKNADNLQLPVSTYMRLLMQSNLEKEIVINKKSEEAENRK